MTVVRMFAVALALSLAVPGAADAASQWQPFRSMPFDLAAGTRCSFALSGRIVEDRERIRTTATNADGTPAQQEVRGRLVVRYINRATGRSVIRDLTGDALFDTRPDGSSRITVVRGHLAVGLGVNDPGGPGFFVLRGRGFAVDIAADGRRTLTLATGRIENVCATLS